MDAIETNNPSNEELAKLFKGKQDVYLFFITWLKNGLNASKAYKKLHPNVDSHSARTLGAPQLAKVDVFEVMTAYSLGPDSYFKQIKAGLEATKTDSIAGNSPDHKTRFGYLQILGKLLGFEKEGKTPLPNVEIVMPSWYQGHTVQNNMADGKMTLTDFMAEMKRRSDIKEVEESNVNTE